MTSDWRGDRIGAAERGENPTVLQRMRSGFAVIGDNQFLPGYCLLLASPQVEHLTDLDGAARRDFLFDMSLLGEAVMSACRRQGLWRVNYEILGNTDTYLHAHVFPRYAWEDAAYRQGPVWLYPREQRSSQPLSEAIHGALREEITAALRHCMTREGVMPGAEGTTSNG